MNRVWVLALAALASGCALGPKSHLGLDGKPVMFIDGMTAAVAYDKAGKACPKGYAIVEEPEQKAFIDYEMSVECK